MLMDVLDVGLCLLKHESLVTNQLFSPRCFKLLEFRSY